MFWRDKIFTCLNDHDEPLSTAEMYKYLYDVNDTILPGSDEHIKAIANLSSVLNGLWKNGKLNRISAKQKGYYYGLPGWFIDGKLKKEYRLKLDNKTICVNVAFVDDQVLFRKGLRELLSSFGGVNEQ